MSRTLPVISLFSGALGLDLGLEAAGFQIKVAVECNHFAAETIRRNRPDIKLIPKKLEDVSTSEILEGAGLKPGEPVLVIGGPSCQAFSTAGQRGSVGDQGGRLFREFLRVVREARPRFFVMENVRGMLSAAIKHRPLRERGPGFPPLEPNEELGSAFGLILTEIRAIQYHTIFDLVNTADFGVPQIRERLIFVGSRDGEAIDMPKPTHSREPTPGRLPWTTLKEAIEGLIEEEPSYTALCAMKQRYLKLVPEGGNWRDLPLKMRADAMGGAYTSWGGRCGFFRRLAWQEPTPALTTRPDSKATMLCHPKELRPLSVAEYARIQQFPDGWEFAGGLPQQYKQAGNAVPVGLGCAVGQALRALMQKPGRRPAPRPPGIMCNNPDLIARMARRPRTFLNPPRMREVKGLTEAREWLTNRGPNQRSELLQHVDQNVSRKEDANSLKKTRTQLVAARRSKSNQS